MGGLYFVCLKIIFGVWVGVAIVMVVGIIVFDGWGLGLVIMGFVLFVSGYLVVYGE